jgi:divinyl chlorophyllide a 8-vinyl-reductase
VIQLMFRALIYVLIGTTFAPSYGFVGTSRRAASRTALGATSFVSGEACTGEKVVVVGATGYIGKAVVRECVRRGYPTTALTRNAAKAKSEAKFNGATLVEADVCDPASLLSSPAFSKGGVDVVISCLASRSGVKKDAYAIDYQATLNALEV